MLCVCVLLFFLFSFSHNAQSANARPFSFAYPPGASLRARFTIYQLMLIALNGTVSHQNGGGGRMEKFCIARGKCVHCTSASMSICLEFPTTPPRISFVRERRFCCCCYRFILSPPPPPFFFASEFLCEFKGVANTRETKRLHPKITTLQSGSSWMPLCARVFSEIKLKTRRAVATVAASSL